VQEEKGGGGRHNTASVEMSDVKAGTGKKALVGLQRTTGGIRHQRTKRKETGNRKNEDHRNAE